MFARFSIIHFSGCSYVRNRKSICCIFTRQLDHPAMAYTSHHLKTTTLHTHATPPTPPIAHILLYTHMYLSFQKL